MDSMTVTIVVVPLAEILPETISFTYPHRKKSQGVRSGDLGGEMLDQRQMVIQITPDFVVIIGWYLILLEQIVVSPNFIEGFRCDVAIDFVFASCQNNVHFLLVVRPFCDCAK